jgi:LmbE family N-acetylglucosaminyl deacetylase
MKRYRHIFLSTHLDDAVLSCAGRIWQQGRAGELALVTTLFTATPKPDAPLSPLAQQFHDLWQLPHDAPARRREEDKQALALLGADAAHWPYLDCIYRRADDGRFLYADEEALSGEIHPADEGLVAELATRVAALPLTPDGTLYAPLGLGRHVDHQIARRAAEATGLALTYYEDYPYVEEHAAPGRGAERERRRPTLVRLSEEAVERKIAAIARYRSQLILFWESADEMAAAVRAFTERVGGGRPAERYWRMKETGSRT